ncbi:ABC ferric siderophore transporter, inner membrane subunit [Oceanicola granulosus HTCC2516]|uniref:ABC ferric siderophore transporter, inner membrane subunit n=1 Tax=Oceanicola granulosus (strain ATCC BAA-861 / DSM 15982 / KCTC 12143 / HTCC2516) TaxID=314256 RepID=Q2CBZ7_OCEGH|nr:iron chelate uptake ABC transporter family permease subunit [Oceanicola granulosus]EAR50197.1 ABC ferric siderophore transporter, inner membrane subunit [Oceanicola granulosus HTCC2516]
MAERRLALLALGLGGLVALFLLWQLRAPAGFILSLRAAKLGALLLVGAATGAATVLFQTVAANRLLTPGIVGFDALFVFLQTALVLALGGVGYAALPGMASFLAETACLMGAAMALFGALLRRGADDVVRMILTGVILGVLLRGLAGFAQRVLEPSEFAIVQAASFATFGAVDPGQLAIAALVLAAALAGALRLAPALDVAALGRVRARTLGLAHDRLVLAALGLVAAMVSVATALVGPITFLGLLAAALARAAVGTDAHARLLPAAALTGALILVAGQTLFERLLGMQSTLAVIVEFAGGLLFLALVLRRRPA